MINLKDLTYSELENFVIDAGEKKFRAKQIFAWLAKAVENFDDMTDISKNFLAKIKEVAYISRPEIEAKYVSADGTVKYVWRLADGECVESVVMEYSHGLSVCISTQAGCAMGCRFCASTVGGKVRNLSAGEIFDQVIYSQKDIGKRISNIVLMGIGEPLDNYDNVIRFLKNITDEKGVNIGIRRISLSTCGIADKIYDLANENLPVTLSVSLHAPTDEIRNGIMPVNRKYNIETLMKACDYYYAKTKRRISFEYTMIKGVNDTKHCAYALAKLVKGAHVNLIPVNEARDNIKKSVNVNNFRYELEKLGVNATVRRQLGNDISASCGQLRVKSKIKEVKEN